LEAEVVERLIAGGRAIGTVESCTGGLVASRITDVPGSSAAFWGSWVTYENRAKVALGVDPELIAGQGAVSRDVAQSLAQAGLARLLRMGAPSPICVATTGIAGPGGGSAEKPVGLCYVSVATMAAGGQPTQVQEVRGRIALSRTEYKQLFAQKALELVRQNLL
jgi:PncC family amidohydrolase